MEIDPKKLKFWFTHEITKYEITGANDESTFLTFSLDSLRKVKKTQSKVKLDWNDCTMDIIGKLLDKKDENKRKLKIVLRSKSTKKSEYMGNPEQPIKSVGIRYMLGINIEHISDIFIEDYALSQDNFLIRENISEDVGFQKNRNKTKQRIGFQLDDRYWIWDWYDDSDVKLTSIYRLHQYVLENIKSADEIEKSVFKILLEENELDLDMTKQSHVIPIIYQPALDSLKNYIRQVHCAQIDSNVYEISIVFNNEVLRKHKVLNGLYEVFRRFVYQRVTDIETFRIHSDNSYKDKTKSKCLFENIYSNDFGIEYDDIHGDPPKAELRDLRYFHMHFHSPIIFINTSNHAMASHDNNPDLWKWEYIPFIKDSPIEFGNLTRRELEQRIKRV